MFGLLSQQSNIQLAIREDVDVGYNGSGGGGAITNIVQASQIVGENKPTQQFDLSVIAGLRPQEKYLGRNRVSDIQEAYQTYITGSAIGRGGRYAVDAARRYGTTITEAARGYLVAAGLPTLAPIAETVTPDITVTPTPIPKNPFEILADILPGLFGAAVYNPPLQTQAYGYTPAATEQPLTQIGGGNIGLFVILGIIGVIAYFLYKRFT